MGTIRSQSDTLQTHLLLTEILDSLPEHICVLDSDGVIVYVNKAWKQFAHSNCASDGLVGVGINYLSVCDAAGKSGDAIGVEVASAIRKIASGELNDFYIEYPCYSPTEKRWFMMRINKLGGKSSGFILIDHHSITERKLAELEIESLVRLDSLTALANRRYFIEFANQEWRRAFRNCSVVTIAMIDCDNFKEINDTHGHLMGDQLLQIIGKLLSDIVRRPGDLAVRYGGDEFLLFYSDTSAEEVAALLSDISTQLSEKAKAIGIEKVSLSIGIAESRPTQKCDLLELIKQADNGLYQAKHLGKNRIHIQDI